MAGGCGLHRHVSFRLRRCAPGGRSADPVGGKYQRTIARVDRSGAVKWLLQDHESLASGVLTLSDEAAFIGSAGFASNPSLPTLTKVRHDGRERWHYGHRSDRAYDQRAMKSRT